LNIFILDNDITKSAQYHVDKHVVKMPLEAAQLLSTCIWVDEALGCAPYALNKDEREALREFVVETPGIYKPTHVNHPCAIWARMSLQNYQYLYEYTLALGDEYTYRYGKEHKSVSIARGLYPPLKAPNAGLTPFAQAMPEEYKALDAVEAYRTYYLREKSHIFSWKNREVPPWIDIN
jgi:hypothetical protein